MAMKTITVPLPDDHAEPAWEVALLFPAQGEWSEDDYLWLTDHTRCLVEFTDGHIEVLPMPTDAHQRIVLFLYRALYAFLAAHGLGIVLVAPLRLRVRTGRYREPDLLLLLSANDPHRSNRYWTGADLVVEVVSPDDSEAGSGAETSGVCPGSGFPNIGSLTRRPADSCATPGRDRVCRTWRVRAWYEATSVLLEDFTVAVAAVLDAE